MHHKWQTILGGAIREMLGESCASVCGVGGWGGGCLSSCSPEGFDCDKF